MRRRAAVVLVAAAGATGCGGDGPPARADGACRLTVDVFPVPYARVREAVPRTATPARYPGGRAAVDAWALTCRRMPLGDRRSAGTVVLLGAVVVPKGDGDGSPLAPRTYEHHLLSAQTDRPWIAAALRARGVPATAVDGLRVARARDRRRTSVPGTRSPYVVDAPLGTRVDRPHDHRNVWWHAPGRGLVLTARGAVDRYCPAARCATLTVRDGPLRRLLGSRRLAAQVSLDHEPLDPELTFLR